MPVTITETGRVVVEPKRKVSAEVVCPMCGHHSWWKFMPHERRVILCPCDSGGCDRYFVAHVALKANVHTATIDD